MAYLCKVTKKISKFVQSKPIIMEISISNELNYIISYSREEAMRTGSYGIAPDHLFLGILRHKENAATDA